MIIFNGEEIVLHYEKRESSFIVVSFIGADHEHEAESNYLLKDLMARENITCLGFTVKKRNFFRSIEMQDALNIAATITSEFDNVISIGHSMGGYACIKYSKAIKATNVIAVSAYYSINVDDLELSDPIQRKRVYFEVAAARLVVSDLTDNMKITADDCHGRVFLIYNPRAEIDAYNARLMKKLLPFVLSMPCYGIPHAALNNLRIPDWFDRLNTSLEKVEQTRTRPLRQLLYLNLPVVEELITAAVRKHPLYCLRALTSDRVLGLQEYNLLADNHVLMLLIYYFLFTRGYRVQGLAYLLFILPTYVGENQPQTFDSILGSIKDDALVTEQDVLLVSAHGGVLCFDVETGCIECCNCLRAQPGLIYVRLRQKNGVAQLLVPIEDKLLELQIQAAKIGPLGSFLQNNTLLATHRDGSVSILDQDGGFLTAMPDSSVHTNSLVVGDWEKFVPLPLVESQENALGTLLTAIDAQAMATAPSGPPTFAALEHAKAVSIVSESKGGSAATLTWLEKSRALSSFSELKQTQAKPRRKWWTGFGRRA